MRCYGWFLCMILLSAWPARAAAAEEQWIVVTAPAFRQALAPLCQERKKQGLRVVVVSTADVLSPREIRGGDGRKLCEHINKLCRVHAGPSFVLLVGAVEAGKLAEPETKVLPPLSGTIGRMKGQPTDNGYGGLDDGRLPSVPVGRFPARTVPEAEGMVAKTLEYERDGKPSAWRRRLTILAGVPAFNPLVDRLVESLALSRLGRLSPIWTGRAIYSNPQSRFALPGTLLHARALQYVQDGEAFTLYLGHSNALGLYGGRAHYLDCDDWARLHIGRGKGVLFTFGCNGCQLTGENGEGYGVSAVRNPNGPAAVAGSHGVCFAAMVRLAADGLFESTLAHRPPKRLGETWLAIKKGLAQGKMDDLTYRLLDAVDGDPSIPQARQRQEHLEMYVLLGDPALRLPKVPEDIEMETATFVVPREVLTVRGKTPPRLAGAKVRVTLERTADSVPLGLEAIPKEPGPARDRAVLLNHDLANRFELTSGECTVKDRLFEARLDVPTKLPWPRLILRVYASAKTEEGLAVRMLPVKKKEP